MPPGPPAVEAAPPGGRPATAAIATVRVATPVPGGDATVPLDPSSGDWLHRRAAASLALLSHPWERLGYDIVFAPARRGIRARTVFRERRIEVYVRPTDPVAQTAFDVAHEVGHAVDAELGTAWGRAEWLRARDLDGRLPWFGCNGCDDLGTPAGDFAESFAAWQVAGGRFASRLGPPPNDAQRALLGRLTAVR